VAFVSDKVTKFDRYLKRCQQLAVNNRYPRHRPCCDSLGRLCHRPTLISQLASTPLEFSRIDSKLASTPLKLSRVDSKLDNTPLKFSRVDSKLDNTPPKLGNTHLKLSSLDSKLANTPPKLSSLNLKLDNTPIKVAKTPRLTRIYTTDINSDLSRSQKKSAVLPISARAFCFP
jgi:hypothetical protein